ncbi:MAG: substrate-binding domain-containing protein [Anaerolineae bacterium]
MNRLNYAMLLWLADAQELRDSFANRVVRHRQSDGVIITSVIDTDPLFSYLVQHNRLFVMVETPPRYADRVNYVTVNNEAAAEEVVQHLVEIGRRRIATVTGLLTMQDAVDRLTGYKNGLQRAGLPVDPALIIYGGFHHDEGYKGMKQLLQLDPIPDAVFAGGDTIATGVIQAIREAGLRVPEDVAVVGFDDLDVAVRANLTTVCHSVQTVGSTAAQLLIDLIEGRLEHPQRIVLPTRLTIRGSTVGV